jgi:hypothetical protein
MARPTTCDTWTGSVLLFPVNVLTILGKYRAERWENGYPRLPIGMFALGH